MTCEELNRLNKGNKLLSKIRQLEADIDMLKCSTFEPNFVREESQLMTRGVEIDADVAYKVKEAISRVLEGKLNELRREFEQL